MPVVNGKHYAYTKKGKDAAKKARAKQNESIAQIVVSRIVEALVQDDSPEAKKKRKEQFEKKIASQRPNPISPRKQVKFKPKPKPGF